MSGVLCRFNHFVHSQRKRRHNGYTFVFIGSSILKRLANSIGLLLDDSRRVTNDKKGVENRLPEENLLTKSTHNRSAIVSDDEESSSSNPKNWFSDRVAKVAKLRLFETALVCASYYIFFLE